MSYTDIDKPSDYFNTKLYSGDNATNQAVTGVGFQPDLVWIKARTEVHQHNWFDVIRGVNKNLVSNSTNAEATNTLYGYLASYDTDGFTTQKGSSADQWNVNKSGENYVAWNWLAGGTAVSNTQGSITSSVSANTTAGFSIVSYTGTGANATVGHGLSSAPDMIFFKNRSSAVNWSVYARPNGAGYGQFLNTTAGKDLDSSYFNSTDPTSSVFSVGTNSFTNGSGNNMIAYCFASIKGFSKIGSYTGNGSTDGTFVYTGFKPAFVIMKRTNTTGEWGIFDDKRNTFNVATSELKANASDAEEINGAIDFLSNGFKLRDTALFMNGSGSTYIYMAFASQPFVTSSGVCATAR